MNNRTRLLAYLVVMMLATVGALGLLAGCQKDKPVVGTKTTQTKSQEATPSPAKQDGMSASMKQEATQLPVTQAAQTAEETTCPVTGDPIDKNIFVEYQGKKVYFCCAACVDPFKANPDKYISKLPQFAK